MRRRRRAREPRSGVFQGTSASSRADTDIRVAGALQLDRGAPVDAKRHWIDEVVDITRRRLEANAARRRTVDHG